MRVADRTRRDVITIEREASLRRAWRLMEGHRIRHLPVVEDRSVVGILTSFDLVETLAYVLREEPAEEAGVPRSPDDQPHLPEAASDGGGRTAAGASVRLTPQAIQRFLQGRCGSDARVIGVRCLGRRRLLQAGDGEFLPGEPIQVDLEVAGDRRSLVLSTLRSDHFGPEHLADRAQVLLWSFDAYGRLPRHVDAVDGGFIDAGGRLHPVAARPSTSWCAPCRCTTSCADWSSPSPRRTGTPRWMTGSGSDCSDSSRRC